MYDLAIIILNYKTPELVVECLMSIEGNIDKNTYHTVVVDNASGDDSIDKIGAAIKINEWNDWVELISSPKNGGFSYGNNIGISYINAKNYLLLNSDTLITDGALKKLVGFANSNPGIGIVTPNLIWPDGELQTSGFRYIHPIYELLRTAKTGLITNLLKKYDVPIRPGYEISYPEWVPFAGVLIKNEVFKEIGYLDEEYFMYFEDVDYCRRAKQHGFLIANYTDAEIIHLNGGSSGINNKSKPKNSELPDYYYASRARYFNKYYGTVGLVAANVLWVLGRTISFVRECFGNQDVTISNNEYKKIWK